MARPSRSEFFFFSSRRRHTRFDCDWSSDVCSSDLPTRRYDAALEAYDRALQLGGVTADLLYNLGVLHVDRYDYESASNMFSQALSLAPADAGLRLAFAQCCFDIRRNQEAVPVLEAWPG